MTSSTWPTRRSPAASWARCSPRGRRTLAGGAHRWRRRDRRRDGLGADGVRRDASRGRRDGPDLRRHDGRPRGGLSRGALGRCSRSAACRVLGPSASAVAGAAPSGCAPNGPAEGAVGSGLRLTYLGHATVMIELDGVRLLTDPVLGRRLGPLRRLGPTPDPAAIGPVDGVLISTHTPTISTVRPCGPSRVLRPSSCPRHGAERVTPLPRRPRGTRQRAGRLRARTRDRRPARHRRWLRHRGARRSDT